jgi:hypothetical protein
LGAALKLPKKLKLLAVILSFYCLYCQICSCQARREDPSSEKIIGGRLAYAGEFPSTFLLSGGCTGTKIAPNYILTAAHCVVDVFFKSLNGPFDPSNSLPLAINGQRHVRDALEEDFDARLKIAQTTVHPSFWKQMMQSTDEGLNPRPFSFSRPYPYDLAVIKVQSDPQLPKEDFEKFANLPVASIGFAPPYKGTREFAIVGYGCEVNANAPNLKASRQKVVRLREIKPDLLDSIEDLNDQDLPLLRSHFILTPGRSLSYLDPSQTPAHRKSNLCPGDSGGPTFWDAPKSNDPNSKSTIPRDVVLVGVNSAGLVDSKTGTPGLGTLNAHSRLDIKWLTQVIPDLKIDSRPNLPH